MATAVAPTSQKKKITRLPPPRRGNIKARIIGNIVKSVVSMVKPADQGKKVPTETGHADLPLKHSYDITTV